MQRTPMGMICRAVTAVALVALHALPALAQHTISGQIRYYANDVPVADVTVQLLGPTPASTQTDSNGQYSFGALPDGTWRVEPQKIGAINQSITAIDGTVNSQAVVGLRSLSPLQRIACDANGSNTNSSIDTTYILQYRVGLIGSLPVWDGCGSDFLFVPTPAPAPNQTPIAPTPNRTPTLCIHGAIAYDPLNGDATNQDFVAILAGDCNGNWPNPTLTPTPTPSITATPTETPTSTSTNTPTQTPPQSSTPTFTPTRTPTSTTTQTPTRTPTRTVTPTITRTPTATPFGGVPWPTLALGTTFTGLGSPTYVTWADNNDGNTRLFVVLQTGVIRLIKNGVLQGTSVLDIGSGGANRIACCGEQGLLSMAFPPGYAAKRYFYVNYTNTNGDTVIARYQLDSVSNDIANVNSEQILLTIAQPFSNHNGGQLQFGPDGYLYIGMGDGGSGNDPQNNAQNSTALLGKMLRIDVETTATTPTPTPYLIPASNPTPNATFTRTPGYRREIWALGVRNPWRFSFDRLTKDLYIADVGQDAWEEVDFQPAGDAGGENYGWRLWEGNHQTTNCVGCTSTGFTFPVTEYQHLNANCSITGGYVYRGTAYPCLHGTYLYADYCTGRIWGLRHAGSLWQSQLLLSPGFNITTFGEDAAGNVYVGDASNGRILQLQDSCVAATLTPTSSPTATPTPTPTATMPP
ncbi:MAG: PQQ-dependent sugar dehydrogenase [Deltaproteobacteria bacterium]|nr:PQQ-dependent sugar dehydrogenase [Deltaproteobacteria bacterium]